MAQPEFITVLISAPDQVFWISNIEGFCNLVDGAGKIGQQISCSGLIVAGQAGNGDIVDALDRRSASPQRHLRREVAVVPRPCADETHFETRLKRMRGFSETYRVAVLIKRACLRPRGAVGGAPKHEVVRK